MYIIISQNHRADKQKFSAQNCDFFLLVIINFNIFLGAQKTHLIETILLSTHKICFGRKIIFSCALLSGGLKIKYFQ